MRISDWSSDVCSSDLIQQIILDRLPRRRRAAGEGHAIAIAFNALVLIAVAVAHRLIWRRRCARGQHAESQQRHETQVSHSPLLICDAESASERSAVDRRTNLPRRYFSMRILTVVMLADRRTTNCPGAGRNLLERQSTRLNSS